MIITDSWTFIHIPRTGGVAFKMAFLQQTKGLIQGRDFVNYAYERQDQLRPPSITDLPNMANFGSEHALVNHWESLIPDNSQLFTIVRHPYERFQSICRRAYDTAQNDEDRARAINIDEVLNNPGYGCWRPANTQKEYLDSTTKSITVYKYETDYANVYSNHSLTSVGVMNESINQTNMLTAENIVRLNEHYHDDFVEFGYTKS